MERVKLGKCLNREIKYYNWSAWAIAGGILLALIGCVLKGMFWGFGAGVAGFFTGGWLGNQWQLGNIQRLVYWRLPFAKLIDKELPPSYYRNLF